MLFVSGTENGDPDHASTLVTLAGELAGVARAAALPDGRAPRLQMGLHTGEVAAGVVGTSSLRYGVFGPAVTIARGLEEASAPGVLRASAATLRRLPRGGRDRGWIPGGAVTLPGLVDPVDTRLLGDAAAVMPLADLRAASAAVASAWDPTARAPARGVAASPALAPALDRALARRAAAADAPMFAAALVATLAYGAALAAAGRLAVPPRVAAALGQSVAARAAAATPTASAVPLHAAAGATLLWAGALAAARAPGYAGERRDVVVAALRALAAVPRVWRAYTGVPAPGAARLAAAARRGAIGRLLAAAAAVAGPGATAGASAAAVQVAVAALVPLPPRAAARAAPLVAALAAAALAARLAGRDLAAALATYAVLGVAAPVALQAVLAARGRAAVVRALA